jgi:hypothetical protein
MPAPTLARAATAQEAGSQTTEYALVIVVTANMLGGYDDRPSFL